MPPLNTGSQSGSHPEAIPEAFNEVSAVSSVRMPHQMLLPYLCGHRRLVMTPSAYYRSRARWTPSIQSQQISRICVCTCGRTCPQREGQKVIVRLNPPLLNSQGTDNPAPVVRNTIKLGKQTNRRRRTGSDQSINYSDTLMSINILDNLSTPYPT